MGQRRTSGEISREMLKYVIKLNENVNNLLKFVRYNDNRV